MRADFSKFKPKGTFPNFMVSGAGAFKQRSHESRFDRPSLGLDFGFSCLPFELVQGSSKCWHICMTGLFWGFGFNEGAGLHRCFGRAAIVILISVVCVRRRKKGNPRRSRRRRALRGLEISIYLVNRRCCLSNTWSRGSLKKSSSACLPACQSLAV